MGRPSGVESALTRLSGRATNGEGPAEHGLDRANWTHEELADHLKRVKGIRTSRSAVQRFCSGIGIRLYRPTYRYDRGDPVEQAKAEADLADLGNGRRPANSCC